MKLPKPFDYWTTYTGHSGIDFPQAGGTPVMALADGVCIFSGWNRYKPVGDKNGPGRSAGITKIFMFGDVEVRYCHLESMQGAMLGERVKLGDDVAYVGSTGLSTGNHLHMEVWVNGKIRKGNSFWYYIDKKKTISKPQLAGDIVSPLLGLEDEDMATIIVQRANPMLSKGIFDVSTGKISRELNGAMESSIWREVEQKNPTAVSFVTVSDADYERMRKK